MKNLRRLCSFIVLLTAPLTLLVVRGGAAAPRANTYRAYVGTYTAKTNSKGIYAFDFDPATGKMSAVEVAAESKDPSWVVVHPNGKFLYAVNETGKASTVSAFAIEAKGGKLTLLNEVPAQGEDPCHLSFDGTGKFLFVANYTSGTVAVFPILADGKLGEHTGIQQDTGTLGPNKQRQEAPHAHFVTPPDDHRSVYVSDLGLDRVMIYKFDAAEGTLSPASGSADQAAVLEPGTGPRHLALSNDRSYMYVLGELKSTVTVFAVKNQEQFAAIQSVHMLPAGFSGRNDAAEIAIHPSGKFLYASNRGHDSIVVYSINPRRGTLKKVADIATRGKEPRSFAIDPTGKFLLAENQLSNTIVEFRIDRATGKLTPTGQTLSVPSPVCVTFLPLH
jgi:6-phosphogluconolactonase